MQHGLDLTIAMKPRRRTSLSSNCNGGLLCCVVKSHFLPPEEIISLECKLSSSSRLNSVNNASLRAVSCAEGHAEAGDRGGAEAHDGDLAGARSRGQKSGEPRGKKAAVQDQQTQPAALTRSLLPHRLSRLTVYSDCFTESPGERRGRGAADRVKDRLRAS